MRLTIYKQRTSAGMRYHKPVKIGEELAVESGRACAFIGERLTGELRVHKVMISANGILLEGAEELAGDRLIAQSWFCAQG